MIPNAGSTRFLYSTIRSLYSYGPHIQLAAFMAALLEMTILWKAFPKPLLLSGLFCHFCLTSCYIFLVTKARKSSKGSLLKVSKTYRRLLFIYLWQALCWGGTVLFIENGTPLLYAIHALFLYSACALLTALLATIPTTAYCFLTISLAPTLYTIFFKTPADTRPLAYCLLVLTILLAIGIYFRSKALHASIHKHLNNQRIIHSLRTQLKKCNTKPDYSLVINTLNEFRKQLQKFTEKRTALTVDRNEAIWNAILTVTDQSRLQNSFSGKLSSLCQPLETDRIYIVEADKNVREASPHPKNKYQATLDHSWIFKNPNCVAALKAGNIIHNQSPQVSDLEQNSLKDIGIQAFLDIPILLKSEIWGIIGMDRLTSATPFTTQQVNGLKLIANILAMTISNQQDRLERDRLVTAIEQSSDCTLITDPAGQILYANPACETVTGYSQPEIIGTNLKDLYSEGVVDDNIWQQIITAMKNGEKWQGQFPNYRKDHTLYEEEMLVSPAHNHKGEISNQVIIKRNITEKKRLESIVEAANLMDNIGFIFSSIRHELGNPINSIKVSLSVLDSNLELYDKNDIKRFVNRSLSDIGRVEYLLKTLKNFSIFERPIIEKTDMTTLLNKFITLITTELQQKRIKLTANIPKEPKFGLIDPRAFQQVLLNLIANAADSLIETSHKKISLSMLTEENGQINIIISDNGCGISDDEQTNLFKPFFTTKPQGTGLGLVIVKKMLAKMNCSIYINSKNNMGTKVLIIIPGP
ncbi:MAG: ATP-binding protein [Deltaproteobacteria bacterium]|nr:ATP-binding protein [Deltaproteobacteria bacterium]